MGDYTIPAGAGESEYIEKRSSFIGRVMPVYSEDEAREFIESIKKKHHDARHNCWCYIIKDGPERYSDDGEPQGTAGIPMMEVFKKEGITNVVCVVTRYFGGILLGTGGLLRAYTKAAKDALDAAGRKSVVPQKEFSLSCAYSDLEMYKKAIAAYGGQVLSVDYGADVSVHAEIPEEKFSGFDEKFLWSKK